MLSFPPSIRIFVATFPVDMRKDIDGLFGIARSTLGLSPLTGHVLVAFNRRRDHVKILWWDRGGFAVFHKRLERGQFPADLSRPGERGEIDSGALMMLLQGLDPTKILRPAVWSPPLAS